MKFKKFSSAMLALALATSIALSGPVTVFAQTNTVSEQKQQLWEDLVDEVVTLFNGAKSKDKLVKELNKLKNGDESKLERLKAFLSDEEIKVLDTYGLNEDLLKAAVEILQDSSVDINTLTAQELKDKLNNPINKGKIEKKLKEIGLTVTQVKNKLAQFNTLRTSLKAVQGDTFAFLKYDGKDFIATEKINDFVVYIKAAAAFAGHTDIIDLINAGRVNDFITKFNEKATTEMREDMLEFITEYKLLVKDSGDNNGGGSGDNNGGGTGGNNGGGSGGTGGGGGGGGAATSPAQTAQKNITKSIEDLGKAGADVSAITSSILKNIKSLDAEGAKAQAGPIISSMANFINKAEDKAQIKQAKDAMVTLVQALVSRVTIQDVAIKDGKATLSASKVAEQIKAAEGIINQLAKAATTNNIELTKSVKVTLSFDLDKEVNDVEVVIPEGLWKAIDKKANVAVKAKGVELVLEHNTFKEQVYTLNVKHDGDVIDLTTDATFTKPIAVTFQIAKGVKNYPTVYQILEANDVVVGGTYDAEAGTITASLPHFSLYTVKESAPKTFTDMYGVTWQREAINELSARGYILGVSETSFAPNANIKRSEFAVMLTRVIPTIGQAGTVGFSDMKQGTWYYDSVATAVKEGWLLGRDGNKFDPNAPVTRQEVATVLSRILAQKGYLTTTDAVEGLNVAAWAKDAVSLYLREVDTKEILALDMSEAATRAEVAVMIYELLNK